MSSQGRPRLATKLFDDSRDSSDSSNESVADGGERPSSFPYPSSCEDRMRHFRTDNGLSGAAHYLFVTGDYSDVTLKSRHSSTRTFKAHKIILAAYSPIFGQMLFGDFEESSMREAIPLYASEEALEWSLRFMYGEMIKWGAAGFVHCQSILETWAFAYKYAIHGLLSSVREHIMHAPSVDTAIGALGMAKSLRDRAASAAVTMHLARHVEPLCDMPYMRWLDMEDILGIVTSVWGVQKVGRDERARQCVARGSRCWTHTQNSLVMLCRCAGVDDDDVCDWFRDYKCAEDHDQMTCFRLVESWMEKDMSSRMQHGETLLEGLDLTLVGRSAMEKMCSSPIAASAPSLLRKVFQQVDRGQEFKAGCAKCKGCRNFLPDMTVYVGSKG